MHLFECIRVILLLSGSFGQELVPYDFPLVVLDTIPITSFHLWYMLKGSVEFECRGTYFGPLGVQTHFSTSWHVKMSLTLKEPV
jgi:hypothetical protein